MGDRIDGGAPLEQSMSGATSTQDGSLFSSLSNGDFKRSWEIIKTDLSGLTGAESASQTAESGTLSLGNIWNKGQNSCPEPADVMAADQGVLEKQAFTNGPSLTPEQQAELIDRIWHQPMRNKYWPGTEEPTVRSEDLPKFEGPKLTPEQQAELIDRIWHQPMRNKYWTGK